MKRKAADDSRKYAFKVLCPPQLADAMMDKQRAKKRLVGEDTGTRIFVSSKEDLYPTTTCRIMVITGREPNAVLHAVDVVLWYIFELGDQEWTAGVDVRDFEYSGKNHGEYKFRALISPEMASGLIGSQGVNIKAMREDNAVKVHIDNRNIKGHQLLWLVASAEGLKSALAEVNDIVQLNAESETFASWAAVRSFRQGAVERRRAQAPAPPAQAITTPIGDAD